MIQQMTNVIRFSSVALVAMLTVFMHCPVAWGQDLVIEAAPGGKNNNLYREHYGKWMDSRIPPQVAKSWAPGLTPPGTGTSRKTVFSGPNIVTTGPAMARFTPDFKEKGRYHVYVTWPRGANAAPVRYVIEHAGGAETKKLTQNGWGAPGSDCNAGTWISLGEYEFNPGKEQFVELHVEADVRLLEPNWYGQAYADAVCFSKEPLKELGVAMSPQAPPAWPGSEPPTQLATEPLKWSPELPKAWGEARAHNRRMLLYFFSEDAFLDHYDKMLFLHPAVQALIQSRMVPVRIDMKKDAALAKKLGIGRAGTIAVYDANGTPLKLMPTSPSPDDFIKELQNL